MSGHVADAASEGLPIPGQGSPRCCTVARDRPHRRAVLQDTEDSGHFVVVRRWDGPEGFERWVNADGDHAGELRSLVPEGSRAAVMTKVADLTAPSGGTS